MEIGIAVVDADESFRHQLRSIIGSLGQFELLAECESVEQAQKAAASHPPDVVFLDASLPNLDVLLSDKHFTMPGTPLHIFVAPDESYALKAFKTRAFDYLVKPVETPQLIATLAKVTSELRSRRAEELEQVVTDTARIARSNSDSNDRLVIRTGGRFVFIKASEIDWIQAARNYVRIYVGSESYLEHRSITSLEECLCPTRFVRIHRSVIVNVEKIKELRCWPTGEYVVLMQNGKELTLSRGFRDRLPRLLGRSVLSSQGSGSDVGETSRSQLADSA